MSRASACLEAFDGAVIALNIRPPILDHRARAAFLVLAHYLQCPSIIRPGVLHPFRRPDPERPKDSSVPGW